MQSGRPLIQEHQAGSDTVEVDESYVAPWETERWRRPKQRGGKRYYRNLRRCAEGFTVDIGDDQWFDLWHDHFDWFGRGNISGRQRHEHLRALFTAIARVRQQIAGSRRPLQTWIQFQPTDSSEDAIYVHTPNPNGSAFPDDFAAYTFGGPIPPLLRPHVIGTDYVVGFTVFRRRPWYAVIPPESMPDRWRNTRDQTPNPSLQRTNPG